MRLEMPDQIVVEDQVPAGVLVLFVEPERRSPVQHIERDDWANAVARGAVPYRRTGRMHGTGHIYERSTLHDLLEETP